MPNKEHHEQKTPKEKAHHQGVKEIPSSLPDQEISSDGKKMPLSEQEKEAHAKK